MKADIQLVFITRKGFSIEDQHLLNEEIRQVVLKHTKNFNIHFQNSEKTKLELISKILDEMQVDDQIERSAIVNLVWSEGIYFTNPSRIFDVYLSKYRKTTDKVFIVRKGTITRIK